MVLQNGPIIRSPFGRVPLPGTAQGDQKRDEFVALIHSICGVGSDRVRLFWLAQDGDTTISTTRDKDGKVITWDASVASRLSNQGSGKKQAFDGVDDEGDTPDTADLSFGDASNDVAFSAVMLANVTNTGATRAFCSKWDTSLAIQEYQITVETTDVLRVLFRDDSAGLNVSRSTDAAISMGAPHLYVITYDGGGGATAMNGVIIYEDGAVVASTASNNASYVAMEDGTSLFQVGKTTSATPAATDFFQGDYMLCLLVAAVLNTDQMYALKMAVNAYYDLSL